VAGLAPESVPGDDILWAPAAQIADALASRNISCVELVEAHLARIQAVNGALNAVIALNAEQALLDAAEADRQLARGQRRGPMHGVPITIKDSFDTRDIVTTAGTMGRRDFTPAEDATVVRRLKKAGAIVLGKTNTPELTMGGGTENPIHGRTNNPYDVSRSPAGSSGGAAAIVAAGGSALDLGSDTGGSVRDPAHVCGVAALKPTAGRVPLTGHIVSFDFGFVGFLTQIGPIARYVNDLALALEVIAGPDDVDPTVAPVPLWMFGDVRPEQFRVAWFTTNGRVEAEPDVAAVTRLAAAALADAGAHVVETVPPLLAETEAMYARIRDADGASCIRRLMERCGTDTPTDKLRARMERAHTVSADELSDTFEQMERLRSRMLRFLDDFDLLVCPPALHAAVPPDRLATSTYEDWAFQTAFNVTGWPAAVVRAGQTADGLPVGVQIVAGPWREQIALRAAELVEDALGGYIPPSLQALT